MSKKDTLKGKHVYNDIIDEAYELEDHDEGYEERKIMNQLVDGEVNVSDDSQNYVPTPREEEEPGPGHPIHNFEDHLNLNESQQAEGRNFIINESKIKEELKGVNLDPESMEIFKYITAYVPQTIEIETKLRPFIPDFIPAVGEVDAFLKIPRPDGKEETLGIEKLDEFDNKAGSQFEQK